MCLIYPIHSEVNTVNTTCGQSFCHTHADAFDQTATEHFLADGFCRADDAIDADELEQLGELYNWCFSDAADQKVRRKALGGMDEAGRQALPQVLSPSKVLPELMSLRYVQRIRAIAERVLGQPVELRSDHMILKPAGYGVATPWHQDQAYHDSSKRYRNINFWLPLDGATVEGGCMQFVPGSHLGPILPHEYLTPGDHESAMVATGQDYWSTNAVAVPCPIGSCSLHHSYCMHYAGPNATNLPRRAYIIVLGCAPVSTHRPWHLPWLQTDRTED